jgi:hypothetical protein
VREVRGGEAPALLRLGILAFGGLLRWTDDAYGRWHGKFRKILDLGAAGWLHDEVCFHGQVKYSFSPIVDMLNLVTSTQVIFLWPGSND